MSSEPENAATPRPTATSHLALSVRQPWAELILSGRKSIEVRSWTTDYRGPLWLHTGQKRDPDTEAHFGLTGLVYGSFIGRFELSSVVRLDLERWERWRTRHLVPGPMPPDSYAWLLRSPMRLSQPIAARGDLRLFVPDPGALALLELVRR